MNLLIAALITSPLVAYFSAFLVRRQQDYTRIAFAFVTTSCLLVSIFPVSLWLLGYEKPARQGTIFLNFYLDPVSYIMLFMTGLLSFVIIRFSLRYMDGDARQLYFIKLLSIAATAVFWLIASGNLLTFFISWLTISASLHRLLSFFNDRPEAIAAARRKFIVSRLGDLFLLSGSIVLAISFKTLSFPELFLAVTETNKDASVTYQIAMLLISLGALAKSAQIPFHSWLPETLEVPTPVSAIMHAGIINAGGYLIIRLSPLFEKSPYSGILLTTIGSATAVYAMLIMVTQTSVKKRLAYSTVGQMGFMIMQCGLGLYTLAMLHIVAHSFYKAYAFLRAGSAVEMGKQQKFFPRKSTLQPALSATLIILFLTSTLILWRFLDIRYFPIAVIWLSVLAQTLLLENLQISKNNRKSYLLGSIFLTLILLVAYASLAWLFSIILNESVAKSWLLGASNAEQSAIAVYTGIIFGLGFIFQITLLSTKASRYTERLAIHIHNGFYFKAYFDKIFHSFLPTTVILKNPGGNL